MRVTPRATRSSAGSGASPQAPQHPAWYFNLRKDPTAEIAVDGARTRVRAVDAESEQRARIWEQGLAMYPGWSTYERRASGRRIAVFVREPL